jgi:hypothetical protein
MKRSASPRLTAIAFGMFGCATVGYAACAAGPSNDTATAVAAMDPLSQAELAFVGGVTRQQIKERLDEACLLYGLPQTADSYSRASSTLVALRKANDIPEMTILNHMIRSHVPGVNLSFPEAAGISAAFLKAGDK